MHCWHSNNEAKKIVNNGVEEPVKESFWWHVFHTLQSVIDVELRSHIDEAEGVDAANESIEHERVPTLMLVVEHRVNCITSEHWNWSPTHVTHSNLIELFGLTLAVSFGVLKLKVGESFSLDHCWSLFDLPYFEGDWTDLG